MNAQELLTEWSKMKTETAEEVSLARNAAREILELVFRLHTQGLATLPKEVVFHLEGRSVHWHQGNDQWVVFLLNDPPLINLVPFTRLLEKGGLREFIVAGTARQNEIVQTVTATRNEFVGDPSINWNWGHSDDDIPTSGKNGTQGVL